jgi:hypothetical protein
MEVEATIQSALPCNCHCWSKLLAQKVVDGRPMQSELSSRSEVALVAEDPGPPPISVTHSLYNPEEVIFTLWAFSSFMGGRGMGNSPVLGHENMD